MAEMADVHLCVDSISPWWTHLESYAKVKQFDHFVQNSVFRKLYFEQVTVPRYCKGLDDPVLLCCSDTPYVHPGKMPVVSVQHKDVMGFNLVVRGRPMVTNADTIAKTRSIQAADLTICPSGSTADMLVKYLGTDRSRLRVVHHGVQHDIFKPQCESTKLKVAREIVKSNRYILCVSSMMPYKNQMKLVEAFKGLEDLGFDLVLIGQPIDKEYFRLLRKKIQDLGLEERVHYISAIKDQEMIAAIYSAASLYVNPSLVESFGLTQLEAMACGAPVAASNCSAMPEICGEAAAYFDPHDVDSIKQTIHQILTSDTLQEEMSIKGMARAKTFDWGLAAQQTVEVCREAHVLRKRQV